MIRVVLVLWPLLLTACGDPGEVQSGDAGNDEASPGAAIAASVPDTDVYVADILWREGMPEIGPPINLTDRAGYDNQPVFSADGTTLFFTSIRDGVQSDIYRFVLSEGRIEPLLSTPESEYSPALMPGNAGLSAVVVEADGTQRLWAVTGTRDGPRPLLSGLVDVGYYAWLDDARIAAFIVDDPPRLVLADLPDGAITDVFATPGRCLQKMPGENALAFVDQGLDPPRLVRLDLETGGLAELIVVPKGSQDFALDRGGVFMARDRILYFWSGDVTASWVEVVAFGEPLNGVITRLAVSPDGDRLAMVVAARAREGT